ncbi:MAG: hypothetical protein R3B46_03575 [Phycisphaerales bacterium]
MEGVISDSPPEVCPTGIAPIDAALPAGGLIRGGVHEWCSGNGGNGGAVSRHRRSDLWRSPFPLTIALHLVGSIARASAPFVCWIGRRTWPSCSALLATGTPERSVFVDASRAAERLWAGEVVLRSGTDTVVVLDGSGMDLTMTRRLQLAARGRGIALLLRPGHELNTPSAASTRWRVSPMATSGTHPRWSVELVRCKGTQPTTGAPRRWGVEQKRDGTGVVCISEPLGDGSGATADQTDRSERLGDSSVQTRRSA